MRESFSSFPQNLYPRFEGQLREAMTDLSNLEAQVAQYMMLNLSDLSFETGASLASKVGVSEVTVSRLLRRLGYEGMRGLKRELQSELSAPRPLDQEMAQQESVSEPLSGVIELEVKALRGVFQQASTPSWRKLVTTISDAERVYVTGFQTVRGIAEDCARRLSLTKSHVKFLSAHDGMLAEWLQTGGDMARERRRLPDHDRCRALRARSAGPGRILPEVRPTALSLSQTSFATGRKTIRT